MNKNLVTGILFIVIALLFNFISTTYTVGTLDNPGAGLFPFIVSAMLLGIGIITVIRTWIVKRELFEFNFKNIIVVTSSLLGFALATSYINMIAGICVLVAVSSLGASTYSVSRIIKIIIGLVAVAFAFKYLLGLNLPLL